MFTERDVQSNPAGCALAYLEQFGWLEPVDLARRSLSATVATAPRPNARLGKEELAKLDDAVAYAFGESFRGQPGSRVKLLTTPRCGCPDHVVSAPGIGPAEAVAAWPTKDIRVYIAANVPTLTVNDVPTAWRWAFDRTREMCGLRPELVPSKRECHIFAGADHIDGEGGVLAWSYVYQPGLPSSWQCEQLYDTGDSWPMEKLRLTVLHEFWHALGRGHSNEPGSFMRPYLDLSWRNPSPGDRSEAQARYGPPSPAKPTPPPTPTPTPTPTPVPPTVPSVGSGTFTWKGKSYRWEIEEVN